jgi:hypothetical protein
MIPTSAEHTPAAAVVKHTYEDTYKTLDKLTRMDEPLGDVYA